MTLAGTLVIGDMRELFDTICGVVGMLIDSIEVTLKSMLMLADIDEGATTLTLADMEDGSTALVLAGGVVWETANVLEVASVGEVVLEPPTVSVVMTEATSVTVVSVCSGRVVSLTALVLSTVAVARTEVAEAYGPVMGAS